MKNSLPDRFPLTIETHEEMQQLWAEFKKYVKNEKNEEIRYAEGNQNIRLTGAALFVDFLCGIPPKKRNASTSYLRYPDTPWPMPDQGERL